MGTVDNFRRVLRANNLSEYTLGALLGLETSPAEIDEAEERAVLILQYLGLLPSEEDIVFCETPLIDAVGNPLVDNNGDPELCQLTCKVSSEPSRGRIGFRWRCRGNHFIPGGTILDRNRRHTEVKTNPLAGYLFDRPRVEYRKFLKILYGVFMERGLNEIADLIGGSKTTSSDYKSVIKEALAVCGWHDQGRIDGPGDVVEVDEVLLVKRKYNRGRIPVGDYWVFGGVSRATKRRFAMRVEDRSRMTLHAEIIDSIAPGSIICSDGWAAYEGIMPTARANNNNLPGLRDAQGNYIYNDHLVVIHEREFVSPQAHLPPLWRYILPECRDMRFVGPFPQPPQLGMLLPFRIHTQSVERQWRQLRESVESSHDLDVVDRKIGHWLYREMRLQEGTNSEKFLQFVRDIRRVYPGPNVEQITANRPGGRMYPNQQVVALCPCDDCA